MDFWWAVLIGAVGGNVIWLGIFGISSLMRPRDELLDLIEELMGFLRTSSAEELPGEMVLKRRARAVLARYRRER